MKLVLFTLASLSRINILRKCVVFIWHPHTCVVRATSGREDHALRLLVDDEDIREPTGN